MEQLSLLAGVREGCRLKKSLYELKQSPSVWFGRFAFVVWDFNLFRSQKDHSVF